MADIPKIRFKGFTEPWEQRKLEDFGKATGGTSIESEFSEDGVYKVISIGSYSENSVYNDQGIRAIKSDKTSNRVLNRNDLTMILNDKTTSGNIIGRVLLIEESGIYVYNQRTERIEINLDEYDPVFLYEMLNAPNIREKIIKQAQGNTQIYVNWTTISLLEYMIPSKEEQVKIGEHLHGISNLIALHQRKCDDTKELKKYMLQKMFPKNGEKFPEIRFKGFTEAWEQRKLGDLADVTKLAGFEFTEHVVYSDEGNIIALRGLNIKNGQLILDDVKYIDGSNFSKLSRSKLFIDDIMFTYVGTVGEVAIIKENDRFYLAPNVSRIRVKSDDSPKFISNYMRTDNFKNKVIFPLIATSSQPALSMENIRKFMINMPKNRDEQDRLAEYFESLDHIITLHQRKCDTLKELKKYMLQNMFPKKG